MSHKGGKMCQMASLRLKINEHMTSVGEEILCVLDKQQRGADVCVELNVRVVVLERLHVAAEFMCNLFQREIETLETLLEKQNKRLDISLYTPDFLLLPVCKEEVSIEQHERNPNLIQEESEPPQIEVVLQELLHSPEEAAGSTLTLLEVKHEDEENRETEPLTSTSTEHMKTQADVEDCGTSQPAGDDQLLSSGCSETETEDSDEWQPGEESDTEDGDGYETRDNQPSLNTLKSHKTQNVKGQGLSLSNMLSQDLKSSKQTTSVSSHKGNKGFSCTVCGRGQLMNLSRHMRIHTGEKSFICTVCDKGFARADKLKSHMMTHTGEKPFTCTVCAKGFTRKDKLKKHMRSHSGEKPFTCTVCANRYTTMEYLKIHMRTHTEERFTCTVCAKGFVFMSSLKKHMRRHTDVSSMTVQHMVVEPQKRGRGRPRKYPVSLPSPVVQHVEDQPVSLPSPVVQHVEDQPVSLPSPVVQHVEDQPVSLPSPVVQHVEDQPVSLPSPVVQRVEDQPVSLPSPVVQRVEDQPKKRKRGRPRKLTCDGPVPEEGRAGREVDKKQQQSSSDGEALHFQKSRTSTVELQEAPSDDFLLHPVCNEDVPIEQHERNPNRIQEEPEPPQIQEELQELIHSPEEAAGSTLTLLAVEHEDEENRETEPLASTSTEHMKTQADVEDCGTSQPAGDDQLLSSGCSVSETEDSDERQPGEESDTEDGDECETRDNQPSLNTLKSHKTQNVKGQGLSLSNMLSQDLKSSKQTTSVSSHKGNKGFSCTVCGRGQLMNLSRHMRIHTGEKSFTCTVCDKGFARADKLKSHMMTHTGEKPFTCTVCAKGFARKDKLKKHMRSHSGEKPFTCPLIKDVSSMTVQRMVVEPQKRGRGRPRKYPVSLPSPVVQHVEDQPVSLPSPVVQHVEDQPVSLPSSVVQCVEDQPVSLPSPVVQHVEDQPVSLPSPVVQRVEDQPVSLPSPVVQHVEDQPVSLPSPVVQCVEDQPKKRKRGRPRKLTCDGPVPEEGRAGREADKKQQQSSSDGDAVKKKSRTSTVELQGAPSDDFPAAHNEVVSSGHQERSPSLVQEDPEPPRIEDGQQELLERPEENDESPLALLAVKRKDDDENRDKEPIASTSTENMKTQADLEDCEKSQTASEDQLLSSECSDVDTKDSDEWQPDEESDTEDSEECETRDNQRSSNTLKSHTTQHLKGQRLDLSNKLSQDQKSSKTLSTKSHMENKSFICAECGKIFNQKRQLKKHTQIHTGEKPFICTVCGKRCNFKANLNVHMRIHTGFKPLMCAVCGKGCVHSGALKSHMRSHTGEKPFNCKVCGKSFSHLNCVQRHMRTHTGEKPFTCIVCGKGCSESGSLKIHMRTHTGEKPCSCSVCGKSFGTSSTLNNHMRTHTGEKPFTCTVCKKDFVQKSHLHRHMRNIHTRGKN